MANDPLSTLCVRRLTRLLEISNLEGLKVLEDFAYVSQNIELEEQKFEGNNYPRTKNSGSNNSNQVKNLFQFLTRKETPHVFGQQISVHTLEFVIKLIEYLKINTSVQGLFRISGNKKRQDELKYIMNKGGKMDFLSEESRYSPHDIAGILKQFFGELPEPLLTKQLYDCYQQLAEMDNISARTRKIETLKYLFLLLPPLNRLLLKKLIELLAVVARDQVNKMTTYNLGVVFAPNIVYTRQPLDSLSDFTENVEPFTDLVSFVIDNASEVFQIPSDFLNEAKEYLFKIAVDKEKNAEVPMLTTYCKQIDDKEFRQEAKDHTHEAIMLLYSQMMDMPDGPLKKDFLEKFQQSYPGTPIFVPKSIKERQCSSSTDHIDSLIFPSASLNTSRFSIDNAHNITTKSCSLPGLLTPVAETKRKRSMENLLSTPQSKTSHTPSTPGKKVKECFKRMRRRSVELFKAKQSKRETPEVEKKTLRGTRDSTISLRSRAHKFFRSYRSQSMVNRDGIKKSISTPILTSSSKISTSSEDDCSVRKLSFGSEYGIERLLKASSMTNPNEEKERFEELNLAGCVNPAFKDTPDQSTKSCQGPVIRKALCPEIRKKLPQKEIADVHHGAMVNTEEPVLVSNNTPKIMNHAKPVSKNNIKPQIGGKSTGFCTVANFTKCRTPVGEVENDTTKRLRISKTRQFDATPSGTTCHLTDITNRMENLDVASTS